MNDHIESYAQLVQAATASALAAVRRVQARRYLSTEEAATYLGTIAPKTLATWRTLGKGPAFVRVGRKVAYDVASLEAFVAASNTSRGE